MLTVTSMVGAFGVLGAGPSAVHAVDPVDPVELGLFETFGVLSGGAIGNAAGEPATVIRGDIGAVGAVTGFPPGVVTGTVYDSPGSAAARDDLQAAYNDALGRPSTGPLLPAALDGLTVGPGVHSSGAAASGTAALGVFTIDGQNNPDNVFIFQIGGALALGANTTMKLINGAQAKNVFWQVNGAGGIGANTKFVGTLMALGAVSSGAGSTINGRLGSTTAAVTMASTSLYSAPPSMSIVGGETAYSTSSTPLITGTTGTTTLPVTITIDQDVQSPTVVPSPTGTWSFQSPALANGVHTIVASSTDGANNVGSFTQILTVDTTPPAVTIDGGATATTNDLSPTISGTTDVAPGQTVTITLTRIAPSATRTYRTLVQDDSGWNITPTGLSSGDWTITARVLDPAGNPNTATQILNIDATAPPVVITSPALTNDSTPTISGTTEAGASVTVNVDGLPINVVVTGTTWSATPTTALGNGLHYVSVAAFDSVGNTTSAPATQSLMVDLILPIIAIVPGTTGTSNDSTPTIIGTTDVAPGAGVNVSVVIDARTAIAAVVQLDGWNVTPNVSLAIGDHIIVASVSDPAGNIGTFTQTLTIDTTSTVFLEGGSARTTTDTTPAITGSGATPGSTVTVVVAGETLTTTVAPDGTWSVTPTRPLPAGANPATVTITDPAGNSGTAAQVINVSTSSDPADPAEAEYSSVGPKRVFDTRAGQSPDAMRSVAKQQVSGGYELQVQMTDLAGFVPAAGVGAVSMNVTSTGSNADGYITVYACGARELVSSVNFPAGKTVANAVVTPVSTSGAVCFYANTPTDIIVDINGWFASGAAFNSVGPKRVFDTRAGNSPDALRDVAETKLAANTMMEVRLTDLAGFVPVAGVGSVSLNVVVTGPEAPGFITVYSCGTRAFVSSVNFVAGQTVANAVVVPVSAQGTVCFYSQSTTDLIVDINGWFEAGSSFHGVEPARVLDTRAGESTNAIRNVAKARVGGGNVLQVQVTDLAGLVPASGVSAVSLNVTAIGTAGPGFLTVFACGTREEVSSLNYDTGATVANAVLAPVSASGAICLYSSQLTDVVVDINGWIGSAQAG